MSLRLTNAGYDVSVASDGRQALDRISQSLPQMAVLDVMMPELTGREVLAGLRAAEATQHILIILTSAGFFGDVDDLDLPVRADGYVSKPFGREELQNRVTELFQR